ncbi:MAG: hypothetical protein DMG38_15970 [Acidobacteria bacterium]|nr:MAG: hypothetical protein DMG38_15970 [Acidobacteriota bacterium]
MPRCCYYAKLPRNQLLCDIQNLKSDICFASRKLLVVAFAHTFTILLVGHKSQIVAPATVKLFMDLWDKKK